MLFQRAFIWSIIVGRIWSDKLPQRWTSPYQQNGWPWELTTFSKICLHLQAWATCRRWSSQLASNRRLTPTPRTRTRTRNGLGLGRAISSTACLTIVRTRFFGVVEVVSSRPSHALAGSSHLALRLLAAIVVGCPLPLPYSCIGSRQRCNAWRYFLLYPFALREARPPSSCFVHTIIC